MFRLKIKVVENRPPDVARDAFRDICKRAFAHIGRLWFDEIFPRHFTAQAKYQYDHKPRGTKYRERKRRLAAKGYVPLGGEVDNVLSGMLMRQLRGGAQIRGFPTRGRVEMRGPPYLRINFRQSSNQPNKKAELTTLTRDESRYLLREFKKFVVAEFKKYRGRGRVRTI